MSNRQDDALPELPVPVSTFLCTKCGHSEDATAGAELHPPCSKCGYLGFVLPGNTYTADQMRAYAQSAIASLQARLDAAEKDAARWRYILDCEVNAAHRYLPHMDVDGFKARRSAAIDAEILRRA